MSAILRIFLVLGALGTCILVVSRVKQSKIRVADSIFWIVAAFLLLLVALVPQIAFAVSDLLGFLSPSNFVFVCVIALMLIKLFSLSCEISRLSDKVEQLTQEIALLPTHKSSHKEK